MGNDDDSVHAAIHELRSFGRRSGRTLNARQTRLVEDLLPKVRLPLHSPSSGAEELARVLVPGAQRVWLEIGFGGGEHLVAQARSHPDVAFIGCEPFIDGVVKVLSAIEDQAIANIRLFDDDARDVVRWLPAAAIDRAFILFPDGNGSPGLAHSRRRLAGYALPAKSHPRGSPQLFFAVRAGLILTTTIFHLLRADHSNEQDCDK